MQAFTYDQPALRVIFGAGAFARLQDELERLGVKRPMFISTPGRRESAELAARSLTNMTPAVHAEAVMHVPIETLTVARDAVRRAGADSIIAFGGGSAIDTSKAVGLELALPTIAVPMTYGGSEVTPFYGYTESGIKKGKRDRNMLPRSVIYDPVLTVSLPANVSGPSGMNAIAHCVEGLYAQNKNPVLSLLAVDGIRALSRSLPVVVN